MGSTDIRSMDLRLGGNPFPTAQQRLQEVSTSFSLPIPSPSKLNRPSQPPPYPFPPSHPKLSGSNITEFDVAASAVLQKGKLSFATGASPLKRSTSYSSSASTIHSQSPLSRSSALQFCHFRVDVGDVFLVAEGDLDGFVVYSSEEDGDSVGGAC